MNNGDDRLATRIGALLDTEVVVLEALGGGGFGRPHRAGLVDGRTVFVKVDEQAPDGFFEHEAYGLRWLGAVDGGARSAEVLAVDEQLLILNWVETTTPDRTLAEDFGRRLAITHDAGADRFGREVDSVLASQILPGGSEHPDWPAFYAGARLQPFLDRAVIVGNIGDHDRHSVEEVISRMPDLTGGQEPPSRVHGDLWSGNVLWGSDEAIMIDPAAYGGHREIDLAMLALFGLPHLDVVLAAYQEVHPLASGWQQRVPLHQLFPLLVHAVIFGGSYGSAAGAAARRALSA